MGLRLFPNNHLALGLNMNLNIDYQFALDWEHCKDMNEARARLSQITNILNKIIMVRHRTKKEILGACAGFKGEALFKLSWDNKLVRLSELTGSSQLADLWQDADMAYKSVKNKQDQLVEDLYALKKMIDFTPR